MLLEILAFIGIIIIALVVLAEIGKMYPLGLIAGTILLIMSLWILVDGLQYKTSEVTSTNTTATLSGNVTTTLSNQTITAIYEDVPNMPLVNLDTKYLLFLSFLLAGLFGIFEYSFKQ